LPSREVKLGIKQVGAGAFGSFVCATYNGRPVGVKSVASAPSKMTRSYLARFPSPEVAACFRSAKELELICSLRSKFVVYCYGGYFRQDDKGTLVCDIVMERYPYTLAAFLKLYPAADLEFRVTMVRRLCRLLLFLIGQSVCHSDIKKNNILVKTCGTPVLCDFGVACAMGDRVGADVVLDGDYEAGKHLSSKYYVHPAARTTDASPVVDMHAFMCIFVEVLYGTGSTVFRTLVSERRFDSFHAKSSEVATRLPRFAGYAKAILNDGVEFNCTRLMHDCSTLPSPHTTRR